MKALGEEVNLNDYLTSCLKQFKSNFHTQLQMIQSLSSDAENIEQKIRKAKQNLSLIDEEHYSVENLPTKVNYKTIDRFCLRVNQFLQYRISRARGLIDNSIMLELQAMCEALHKVFAQMNRDKNSQENFSILAFFMQIQQVETKYMIKILKKIIQILNLSKIHDKAPSLIKQMLQQRITKKADKKLQSDNDQQTLPTQTSISYARRIELMNKPNDYYYASRLRPRRATLMEKIQMPSVQSSFLNNIFQSKLSIMQSYQSLANPEEKYSSIRQKHVQDQDQQVRLYGQLVQKSNKFTKSMFNIGYQMMQDIVDFDHDFHAKPNQEAIMKQLIQNNKKNFITIQRFRKKARRIKNRGQFQQKIESITLNLETKHKRSLTLDASKSRKGFKKQQKILGLPSLKRRNAKN